MLHARERVLVAMSGGVDSSVAAARLHDAGYEVVGVTLHLWDYGEASTFGARGRCCAPEDQYDAQRVADAVGFAHYTFDRRNLFERAVVEPFVESYVSGLTPSPCISCNSKIKLAELFGLADRLGARLVATGHYARVVQDDAASHRVAMGADRSKDQSYFLYALPSAWLARLIFPLGDSMKMEVRAEALRRGLPGATKGESQELCFVGSEPHAHAAFVAKRAPDRIRAGPILDEKGLTIGLHDGVHRFTIGQRRGLGVSAQRKVFVVRIDAESAEVHVGDEGALRAAGAELTDVKLADGVALPLRTRVRIRYRHEGAPALVTPCANGSARVLFDRPERAVTPGQAAVFYDGDRVVGGGRIASSLGSS